MSLIKNTIRDFYYRLLYIYNKLAIRCSIPRIKSYKNKYKGQRCFIIGNGPSLTTEDLEKLNKEITFASNGIYFVYDKTDWRPTFYSVQDSMLINNRYKDIIKKKVKSQKIVGMIKNYKYPLLQSKDIKVNLIVNDFGDEGPVFSEDAVVGFIEGWTVSYFSIQLAVYMGFKEIYLLGVDHSYGGAKDHFSPDDICDNLPRTDKTTLAYISAKNYADKNGIKIFNATRGGKLEVFERVNFDDIF